MLQFFRSLVSVKKVRLIYLSETSRNQPFRDAHRWIVGIYFRVLDRNGESFYICGIRRTKFLISLLLSENRASPPSFIFIHSSQPPHSLQS